MSLLAFPTAKGAGAYTTGGAGGVVVHVTTTQDAVAGSLREALTMTVPRTIVFDVSGVFMLDSFLYLDDSNSNFTLSGQTAPLGGVTVDGNRIFLSGTNNYIMRFIRWRGGIDADLIPNSGDGLGTSSFTHASDNISNLIVDHVSISFGNDENGEWYKDGNSDVENVTIQNTLYAQGFKGGILGRAANYTGISGGVSFINNLHYNSGYRFPNISGDGISFDIINNVVWTTTGRLTRGNGSFNLRHENNYYDYGNYPIYDQTINLVSETDAVPTIYTSGNKIIAPNVNAGAGGLTSTVAEMNADNTLSWKYFVGNNYGVQLPSNYFTSTKRNLLGEPFTVLPADINLLNQVVNNVGANKGLNADGSVIDNTDVLDKEWLDEVRAGNFVPKLDKSQWNVPAIPSTLRPNNFYVSNPHIPEAYLNARGITGTSTIHNEVQSSGYTLLQEYHNEVDNDITNINKPTITLIGQDIVNIELGELYIELGATATDVEDGDLTSNIVITGNVDTNTEGTYYVYYNVTDSESNTATQVVRTVNVVFNLSNTVYNLTNSQKINNKLSKIKLIKTI